MASINEIIIIGTKSTKLLASKHVSDHWKEKVFSVYSLNLFKQTILLAGYFIVDIVIVGALIYWVDKFGFDVGSILATITGIIATSIIATVYFFVRKNFVGRSI